MEENSQSQRKTQRDEQLDQLVLEIIDQVRVKKDESLRAYTEQYDGVKVDDVVVSAAEFTEARELVSPDFIDALHQDQENIQSFHEKQSEISWYMNDKDRILIWTQLRPLEYDESNIQGDYEVTNY